MTIDRPQLRRHAEQAIARCRELARITDVPGQTTRTFLSPATRQAQARVRAWMEAAGLVVTIDEIGNLHGVAEAERAGTPRLLIGSHLDTVIDAGAFDGVLGIALGIALVDMLRRWPALPFAIGIVAFSEEEGVRFGRPFLGSLSLIGDAVPVTVLDADRTTLAQAIAAFGHTPTPASLVDVFAYLEFHLEQGPVLDAEHRSLAAVSAIAGQTRQRVHFRGGANHAGTTPMHLRRDALAAAAQWIVSVETCALGIPGLVATVGSIEALPNLGNVIAGQVTATLDLRHPSDALRRSALDALTREAHAAANARRVACTIEPVLDQPAVAMDSRLTAGLLAAAARCGHDARPMPSGAGHDAMILARRVPSAMLLLRTPGGLSHHPDESVLLEDVEAALSTGIAFLSGLSPIVGT